MREMFASTNSSLGQSSNSPFGSQHNSRCNRCGQQTSSFTSMFGGGTSTGAFAAAPHTSSPFTSNTTFGPSSFGASSVPAFGQSSTPAFGNLSGCVVSPHFLDRTIQAAILLPLSHLALQPCVAHHQVLPCLEGSPQLVYVMPAAQTTTPFTSNTTYDAFSSSVPAFGCCGLSFSGQKPGFGGGFGSTPTETCPFGRSVTHQLSQPASGSSIFDSSKHFGASTQPAFGSTTTPAFGVTSTPAFRSTLSPTLCSVGTPLFAGGGAFGSSSISLFGSSSTPAFSTWSTPIVASSAPAFAQSSSAFGSRDTFGATTTMPFGGQTSAFGSPITTPAFGFKNYGIGLSGFGHQLRGSRLANYTPTTDPESSSDHITKLKSISAMPIYNNKSHEELRCEDYQSRDKGVPLPFARSTGTGGWNPSAHSTSLFAIAQTSSPFPSSAPSFGSSAFGSSSTSATTPSNSWSFPSPFAANSSPSPRFVIPTSLLSSAPALSKSSSPSGLFGSTAAITSQPVSGFGQSTSPFAQQITSFSHSSLFNSPSGLDVSLVSTTAPLASSSFGQTAPPSISSASEPAQPDPPRSPFDFSTFGQTEPSTRIKVMPVFHDKSQEELRWEDHQLGDKASVGVASKLRSLFKKANTEELNSMLRILSDNKPEASRKQIVQLLNEEIQKLFISL